MATKVKGLFKGLRYFTQIFAFNPFLAEEKEDEIQIGFPTDVKHVAHIGWEGPSAPTPTWMKDFKSSPEVASGATSLEALEGAAANAAKEASARGPTKSSNKKSSDGSSKHSRRRRSSDGSNDGSKHSTRDSSGSSRHARRHRHSNHGSDSTGQDLPNVPKQNRRRRSKESDGVSETRSHDQDSLTDISFPRIEPGISPIEV